MGGLPQAVKEQIAAQRLDLVRKMSNASTALLLSPSGYHAFTMGEASLGTQLSRAMSNIYNLEPLEAWRNLAELPTSPVTYNIRGGNWCACLLVVVATPSLARKNAKRGPR